MLISALISFYPQSSSAPASPTSPLDVNKMQECALAEKARLLREILDCRPSLAAREQECAKLGEELAQLKYENEELLEVVGGAVRELEAEHCAAAARKAQVERLERAASESAKAAAAAKAKVSFRKRWGNLKQRVLRENRSTQCSAYSNKIPV